MVYLYIAIGVVGVLLLLLLTSFICFMKVFYSPSRKPLGEDEFEIPPGKEYEPYREVMVAWVKELRSMPYEELTIKSAEGLTLRGRYYECEKGAPIEILFHGYQGNAERDLAGGVERCFSLGHNVLLVNHRAGGDSDGHIITFGVKECDDCLLWINQVIEHFGKDVELVIGGVSMGAATVMMASGKELPENVKMILADCGYSSARAIIRKVIGEMHLPVKLLYPFVKLGARIFGGFDLEKEPPVEAVKKAKVPIIFLHGDIDGFVPCYMSHEVYAACASPKKLVEIPGAEHGVAFPANKELYLSSIREFMAENHLFEQEHT